MRVPRRRVEVPKPTIDWSVYTECGPRDKSKQTKTLVPETVGEDGNSTVVTEFPTYSRLQIGDTSSFPGTSKICKYYDDVSKTDRVSVV